MTYVDAGGDKRMGVILILHIIGGFRRPFSDQTVIASDPFYIKRIFLDSFHLSLPAQLHAGTTKLAFKNKARKKGTKA